MKKIQLKNKSEYESLLARGIEPLTDYIFFEIEIRLRVSLQYELFGDNEYRRGDVVKANQRFYKWSWYNSDKICENCMKPLYANKNIDSSYSAKFVSHILSRSNCPEMAHDPRNKNMLCVECHRKWESPKNIDMLIYPLNMFIISILKNEYKLLLR